MYLSENIFILVAVRFRCAGPRSALFKEIVNNQDFSTSGLSFFAYGCKGETLSLIQFWLARDALAKFREI